MRAHRYWLCVLGLVAVGPAAADFATWSSRSPDGGEGLDVVVDPSTPSTVYLATRTAGVFKSTDSGGTWAGASDGIAAEFVGDLAVDPNSTDTLYAVTTDTVYKTADAARSWLPSSAGIPADSAVLAITVDPSDGNIVYAAGDDGVYKSIDAGASWSVTSSGLGGARGTAIVVDPSAPDTVYVATETAGIFKSTDGAASWSPADSGVTTSDVRALAIHPVNPPILYAATAGGGVFKTTDGGGSWSPANSGLGALDIRGLTIDPSAPSTVYALANNPGGVVIYKSTDDGGSWSAAIPAGLAGSAGGLAVDPSDSGTLYGAVAPQGLLKSSDGAGTWAVSHEGVDASNVRALAIDHNDASVLYAGTAYGVAGGRVEKSTTDGSLWATASSGLGDPGVTPVRALTLDPSVAAGDPDIVFAGLTSDSDGGIYRSVDGAGSWSAANGGAFPDSIASIRDVIVDPTDASVAYAAYSGFDSVAGSVDGVLKSTDGGTSWSDSSSGLASGTVIELAMDPTDSQTLYAATFGGLFKSTDGGASWIDKTAGLPDTEAILVETHPASAGIVYVGLDETFADTGGLFKSIDGGDSWSEITPPASRRHPRALAIDPGDTDVLFLGEDIVGDEPHGIYRSTDGGTSWRPYSLNIPHTTVTRMEYAPSNSDLLFAGTGRGLQKLEAFPDADNDGPMDVDESGAPNNGDGNGDGLSDGNQPHVASVPLPTSLLFKRGGAKAGIGEFLTVEVRPADGEPGDSCQTIANARFERPRNLPLDGHIERGRFVEDHDPIYGIMAASVPDCEAAEIDIHFHRADDLAGEVLRRYGPTVPGDRSTTAWYAGSADATRTGHIWTFTIADGEPGDDTGDDGLIKFVATTASSNVIFNNSFGD